ncbi:hypothetical protein DCC85_06745 [Paenibacillus sp. CAA11]|uniref:hypothetical protein n=1 Tax=Paenibacillus sp. CAA11 TaxID=1532905 RepID=UPI000D39C58F|nr:hypothetical protein [Paenibacillus sp. CAA11]AWB43948.1 hypothetical protein DCC85_06745 [Paenibacillus sp. CAA11]
MENTICPWCQTEIVWDEEIGPEEECPHCNNELKGYRTISVTIDSEEEAEEEAREEEAYSSSSYWDEDDATNLKVAGALEAYLPEGTDLLAYESAVEKIMDAQDQVPECPHCREYMLFTGTQSVQEQGFKSVIPGGFKLPLLDAPFKMNVYVCSSCFHVSSFLSEDDRLRLVHRAQQLHERS